MPSSRAHQALTRRDWQSAVGVFALVVAATFPAVIPFVVIGEARVALRISNVLPLHRCFLGGMPGFRPGPRACSLVAVGAALVAIANHELLLSAVDLLEGSKPDSQHGVERRIFPYRLPLTTELSFLQRNGKGKAIHLGARFCRRNVSSVKIIWRACRHKVDS